MSDRQKALVQALRRPQEPAKRSAKAKALVKALEAQGQRHALLVQMLRDGGTRFACADYCKARAVIAKAEAAWAEEKRIYGRHAGKTGKHMQHVRDILRREHERYASVPRRIEPAYERFMAALASKPFLVEIVAEISKGQP